MFIKMDTTWAGRNYEHGTFMEDLRRTLQFGILSRAIKIKRVQNRVRLTTSCMTLSFSIRGRKIRLMAVSATHTVILLKPVH
jgi:hypothetical protein